MEESQDHKKGDYKQWKIGMYTTVLQGKKCDLCSHVFNTLYTYYKHRNRCSRQFGYFKVCRHCGREFYFLSLYRKHFITCWKSHREKVQTKRHSECKSASSTQNEILEEILPPEDKIAFPKVCPVCKINIRSLAQYKLHSKRKGMCRPKPYTCEICGRVFKKIHHLLSHEKRKTPCSPSLSKGMFPNRNSKDEIFSESEDQLNKQKLIKKISETGYSLNNEMFSSVSKHPQNVQKEKPFLRSSQQHAKKVSKKDFVCEKCGMFFSTRQFYFRHLMRSTPCDFDKLTGRKIGIKKVSDQQSFLHSNSSSQYQNSQDSGIIFYNDCRNIQPSNSKDSFQNDLQYTSHSKFNQKPNSVDGKVKQTARKTVSSTSSSRPNMKIRNDNREESQYMSSSILEHMDEGIKTAVKSISETSAQYWMAKNDNSDSLVCDICHKVFLSFSALNKHVKKHPPRKKVKFAVKCPVCLQVFYSAYLLLCHQKNNRHWGKAAKSRTIEYKCPFCDKNFLYIQSRNTHIRNHIAERPQDVALFLQQTTCKVCLQPFVSEGIKLQHMKISHPDWAKANLEPQQNALRKDASPPTSLQESKNPTTSQTRKVGRKKPQRSAIVVTAAIEAMLKKHPNTCPVCRKTYCNTFVRDRHFKLHTMEKNFGCNLCPEKFFRSEHLTHHMQKIHNDQLMFECLGCGLRFPTRVHTIQHISKVHTDYSRDSLVLERILSSEACVKKVEASPKILKTVHVESEDSQEADCDGSDDQNNFCEICQIKFAKATRLQRHRLSKMHRENFLYTQSSVKNQHKSTDKLECSICGLCFESVACFVPHRLGHFNFKNIDLAEINDLNPYQCEICLKTLDHHQRVQMHLLWHLRSSKFETCRFPKVNTNQSENHLDSKVNILKTEKKTEPQVAKKTFSNSLSKPAQNSPLHDVKKPLITCEACHIGFTTKHHYTAHVRRYCQVRKTPSSEVEKSVSTRSSRLLSPKCQYCSLELTTINDLKWHEKSCRKVHGSERDDASSRRQINCIQCHCSFFTVSSFENHKIAFCEKNSTDMHSSSSESFNRNFWVENEESEVNSPLAICVPCKEEFSTLKLLISHLKACKMNSWGCDKVKFLANNNNSINCASSTVIKTESSLSNNTESASVSSSNFEETKEKYHIIENTADATKDDLELPKEKLNKDDNSSVTIKCKNIDSYDSNSASFDVKESKQVGINSTQFNTNEDKESAVVINSETEVLSDSSEKITAVKDVLHSDADVKSEEIGLVSVEENSENFYLSDLRENFSQLLYLLVADPELMQQLGWGQRLIDNVLEDVLQHMGQQPIGNCSGSTELHCLRENIQLLLQMCLKDQLMSSDSGTDKSVDSIVLEVLELFKAGME